MVNMKRVLVLTMGISLLFAGIAFGQMQQPEGQQPGQPGMPDMQQAPDVDVDNQELERFAEALVDVQMIQQDAQGDVQDAIADSHLEMERFQEIHQGQMAPQAQGQSGETDVSSEEQSAYDDAISDIQEIEMGAAEEMEEAVVDQGFEVERFNMLAQAIPQDPELSQQLNEIAQEIMQERN